MRTGHQASTTPAGPVAGTARRLPAGTLALLAAAVFAAVSTEVMPVGLLPQLAAAFAVPEDRIGWWMSAYALVVALGAVPVTALLAHRSPRGVLVALLLVYALANGLVVLAGSTGGFALALAARLLGGLAHAGLFSVAVATAVAVSPPGRSGRAVALVNTGITLALALGVPLGTAAGAAWGWRWAFAATTGVLLLLAAAAAVLVPARPPATPPVPGPRGATGPRPGRTRAGVLGALRGRPLLLVATTTVVLTLGHYGAYTYVTPLLLRAGAGQGAVGPALLGYGLASFAGLLLAGATADRHPLAALRAAIAVIAACLLALGPASGHTAATVAVVVLWGAAFGALPSLLQTAALRASDVPGAAPAVVNSTFNVGIAVGAWAGGRALLGGGPVLLTAGCAALVLLALATTFLRPGARRGRAGA
ncbi:MFS transporter [Kineococcus sp. SYSU DK005]|uniref:MFS transporter n=1 Tax=Kineococcus sp. SYSU DK005 TaxID=3383126 RepID=UPI003D7E624C